MPSKKRKAQDPQVENVPLTAPVYDTEGKVVETIELPGEFFARPVNTSLMAQAVKVYQANQHKGTAKTKTRGEVAGSTVKLYRQKGTGRARAGSRRAPQRVGGGVVFGPQPRDVSRGFPKRMRRGALFSALSSKWQDHAVTIVTGLEHVEPKTKQFAKALHALPMKGKRLLLVLPGKTETVVRGVRNLPHVDFLPAPLLSPYEVLRHDRVLLMKEALEVMKQTWGNKRERAHGA